MLLSLATVNIDRSEIMPVNFSNGLKKWRRGYCLLGPVVDEEMRGSRSLAVRHWCISGTPTEIQKR